MMGFNGIGYGFGFGGIFMLLFWGLLIWLIFSLVRHGVMGACCGGNHADGHSKGASHDAVGILKERYAKGEINKEDFDRIKKDLEK